MTFQRALLLLSAAALASAATPDGQDLYVKNCAACHETLTVIQNHVAMKSMSADYIVRVMDYGAMRDYAAKLNKDERVAIATFLAGKAPSASATVASTTGRCSGDAR